MPEMNEAKKQLRELQHKQNEQMKAEKHKLL